MPKNGALSGCGFSRPPADLYVIDVLWSMQQANLLPAPPSKEMLKGNPKNEETSYCEVLVARRLLRDRLFGLCCHEGQQALADRFALASQSLQAGCLSGAF